MPLRKVEPESIAVTGGMVHVTSFGVVNFYPNRGLTMALGKYDLAELLRKVAGSDAEAIELVCANMKIGHRFTDDPHFDPRLDPVEGF